MITFAQEEREQNLSLATIKVVGVGGAGGNTINCMVDSNYQGVEFVAINTDAQALKLSKAHHTLQIGQKSTKGLGAGANPEIGKRSAEEDLDKVLDVLKDADIVFVAGGMGGGTGSGALPVIVKALKEKGILTIVVVTKPFAFEGKRRLKIAESAIEEIKQFADTLLIVPNQKLLDIVDDKVSMIDGFAMINQVLNHSVRGISDIITRAGHINVDFADVKEIMKDRGLAVMGTARASGQDRAKKAALEAISSPLLENMSISGARGVLLNITGGPDLSLYEISQAASVIYEQADADANIILGSVIDNDMKDELAVTVIATGFAAAKASQVQKIPGAVLDKSCRVTIPENDSCVLPSLEEQNIQDKKETQSVATPTKEHVQEQKVVRVEEVTQEKDAFLEKIIQENYELKKKLEQNELSNTHKKEVVQPGEALQEKVDHVEDRLQSKAHAQTPSGTINLQDLDIPTFMRKGHPQKGKLES